MALAQELAVLDAHPGADRLRGTLTAPAGQQDAARGEGDDNQRDDSQQPATARAEPARRAAGRRGITSWCVVPGDASKRAALR